MPLAELLKLIRRFAETLTTIQMGNTLPDALLHYTQPSEGPTTKYACYGVAANDLLTGRMSLRRGKRHEDEPDPGNMDSEDNRFGAIGDPEDEG